ncbi:MAG: hypothetical protein AAGI70_03030 [Pseudomonadota bacterium]
MQNNAYDPSDLTLAVNLSAILGWCVAVFPLLAAGRISLIPYAAVIGLPIAFVACWVVGAPILRRLMRNKVSWSKAGLWGAVIAMMIELLGVSISRYRGWLQSRDDSFWSRIGGGEYVRSVDGILTPYGWWVQAQSSALWVLAGVVIALIVRGAIGPGRDVVEEQDI